MTTTATRKVLTNKYAGRCACGAAVPAGEGTLSRNDAGAWIVSCGPEMAEVHMVNNESRFAEEPYVETEAPAAPAPTVTYLSVDEVGVYVMPDGCIVKAQANKAKTKVYAKKWVVIGGERLTEADTVVHGEWEYVPGLVNRIPTEGRKMTLDEAKAFILRYGQCVRCARKLKAAESVERGIGPTCIKYFGAF